MYRYLCQDCLAVRFSRRPLDVDYHDRCDNCGSMALCNCSMCKQSICELYRWRDNGCFGIFSVGLQRPIKQWSPVFGCYSRKSKLLVALCLRTK